MSSLIAGRNIYCVAKDTKATRSKMNQRIKRSANLKIADLFIITFRFQILLGTKDIVFGIINTKQILSEVSSHHQKLVDSIGHGVLF